MFRSQEDVKKRKILTESGVWIPATYKTDRYERWKGKSKFDQNEEVSDDTGEDEKGPSRFDGGNQRRGVPMGMISTGSSARGFPRTCGKLAHRWNKRAYINFSNRKDAVDDQRRELDGRRIVYGASY